MQADLKKNEALLAVWEKAMPDILATSHGQLNLWLEMYTFPDVRHSICECASKCLRLSGKMSADYTVRFVSSALRHRIEKRAEAFARKQELSAAQSVAETSGTA